MIRRSQEDSDVMSDKTKEKMSQGSEGNKEPEKDASLRPCLRLVYDADAEAKETKTARPSESKFVHFMKAFADSVENDVRAILEF